MANGGQHTTRRFLFYCALIVLVTPFVLPVFWNELTWINLPFVVAVGGATAALIVISAILGSQPTSEDDSSTSRLRRAIRNLLDSDE